MVNRCMNSGYMYIAYMYVCLYKLVTWYSIKADRQHTRYKHNDKRYMHNYAISFIWLLHCLNY